MRFSMAFITVLACMVSCSKKSANDDGDNGQPDPGTANTVHYTKYFTKYKNPGADPASIGLQLKFDDTANHQQVLLYGDYNADKTPKSLYYYQLLRENSDTVFNYQVDDTLGLAYLYFTVKNQSTPLPGIVKFSTTPAGLHYVALYNRNWAAKTDSLLKEFYYDSNYQQVYANGRSAMVANRVNFSSRDIFTLLGLDDDAIETMRAYKPTAVKIAAAILLSTATGGAADVVILARLAAAALTANVLWDNLGNILDFLIKSSNADEIPYGATYPNSTTQQTGGDYLNKYKDITTSYSTVPPVLLYAPQLAPDQLTMNIVCNFMCGIANYKDLKLYMPAMGPNQQTDSAAFFFTRSNGQRIATLHKQRLQNVTIDNNNIVRGQLFISNVWPINRDWTMDSVRMFFQRADFYAGASVVGSGWGPISNLVPLKE